MRRKKPFRNPAQSGFGIIELLVSTAILSFLLASSIILYLNSSKAVRKGSARDAIYSRIADDLEELRRETWRFACEDGTGCTGEPEYADIPSSYKTSRQCTSQPCDSGELLQISALTSACSNKTMGSYMATNHKNSAGELWFPLSGSTTLDWPDGNDVLGQTSGVTIQRTISLNTSDSNQVEVAYTANAGGLVAITLNASLVPEALSWCP